MTRLKKFLILLLCLSSFPCFAIEKTFYILHGDFQHSTTQQVLSTLKDHHHEIDMLISQAYDINQQGKVKGFVDPFILAFAKAYHIKFIVLVTNVNFDTKKVCEFLHHPKAQSKAIDILLKLCKKNHYDGVQFDFEMVPLAERHELTRFYKQATEVLHYGGFKVSYAVAPIITDDPSSEYLKKSYHIWQGAYDLKALGQMGDFVTVMAYDQHTEGVTPGPTASIDWVAAVIKHTLNDIPANKLLLGIPTYSVMWFTAGERDQPLKKIKVRFAQLGYSDAQDILNKNRVTLTWDNKTKVHYAMFQKEWLNQFIFVEDARSFATKVQLVNHYKLKGISVFVLGKEDPKIWDALAKPLTQP